MIRLLQKGGHHQIIIMSEERNADVTYQVVIRRESRLADSVAN